MQPSHHPDATSVPAVADQARPALATARQLAAGAAKTTSTGSQGKTSSASTLVSSDDDVNSVDRSCSVIPVTEAARTLFMVALCNRADHYIFMLWFVLLSFFLFLA